MCICYTGGICSSSSFLYCRFGLKWARLFGLLKIRNEKPTKMLKNFLFALVFFHLLIAHPRWQIVSRLTIITAGEYVFMSISVFQQLEAMKSDIFDTSCRRRRAAAAAAQFKNSFDGNGILGSFFN